MYTCPMYQIAIKIAKENEIYQKVTIGGLPKYFEIVFKLRYHPISWWDSISRPIDPSSVACGYDTTRPRRQGQNCFLVCKYTIRQPW
jgi:hypothetical protein